MSTDIWSTKTGNGIIALRAQYIKESSDNCELKQLTLGLKLFNEKHTSVNIKDKILEIMDDYKLSSEQVIYTPNTN